MMAIFVFLSLAALVVIFLLLQQQLGGQAFLRASLIWGVLVVASTELFSMFKMVNAVTLSTFWIITILALGGWIVWLWKKGYRLSITWDWKTLGVVEKGILAATIVIALVTLFVALKSPVQTFDSITYHMARVAHWTQNQSVGIYASGIERQNVMGPWAEFAVLHLYILQGGDTFVNLVNWFAFIGCIFGSAHVARLLGANRKGAVAAALFAATLPMAIVQASSTTTDIVVSYWVLCTAAEILVLLASDRYHWFDFIYLGMAVGLALLTKATAFAFILPLLLWFGLAMLAKRGLNHTLTAAAVGIVAVLLVNGLFWLRMDQVYGTPLGPVSLLNYHKNEIISPTVMLSNVIKNVSLHIRTENETQKLFFFKVVVKLHQWLGIDAGDSRTTMGDFQIFRPGLNEDTMSNSVHLLFIGISAMAIFLVRNLRQKSTIALYTLSVLAAFLIFSIGNKWQFFGIRLQLPFFLLAAPIFGVAIGEAHVSLRALSALVLFVSAYLPLLSLEQRPIIAAPGKTTMPSILLTTRRDLFPAGADVVQIADELRASGCRNIGLMLNGDDPEYDYWFLLGAPREPIRIEWIVAGTQSAAFSDASFTPCAIVCTSCDQNSPPRKLAFKSRAGNLMLFVSP